MRSPTHASAVALLALALAAPCAAQRDSSTTLRWCWRGRPLPQCGAFWITESDADVVISTTTERAVVQNGTFTTVQHSRHFMNRWAVTIGPMVNTAPLRAIGGTLSISPLYNNGYRVAAELRRRWWSPEGSAVVGTSWGAGFGSRPAVYATIIAGLGFLFLSYAFNEAT